MSVLLNYLLLVLPVLLNFAAAKRIVDPYNEQVLSDSNTRIIGGVIAEPGFAPYQVSLQNIWNAHDCGGAIIEREWILTAAHCVLNKQPQELLVVTGTNQWEEPGAKYIIKEIYMHCNFDRPYMHNDIALLELTEPIVYNELTQPVPLPISPLTEGDEVILTGWGSEEPFGDPLENLRKLSMNYIPYKPCKEIFNNSDNLDVGHICTLSRAGEGGCHGDSGGPLVSNGYLVGVVNWGRPCGVGFPDAQANVYFYADWIRRIISGNRRCP